MAIDADPVGPPGPLCDADLIPVQATKPCKACDGKGSKPGKFLGTPDDPCPECAGTGLIEVVEEPLTPWQQRVEKMLAQVLAYVEPGVARDEAEDVALGLAKGDWS